MGSFLTLVSLKYNPSHTYFNITQSCRTNAITSHTQDLADVSYLLSPQDLMALEQLPAMVAAGVGCFKIEGRLKGPEYVAATTAAYRAGGWGRVRDQGWTYPH